MLVVDLFCGCGGFSTGATLAGHQVVLAIDNWTPALIAHEHNHPETTHLQLELGGDLAQIRDLISEHIHPRDTPWHLHGSPPCQNLSAANKNGNAVEGMRLVRWFLSLVKLCRPTTWSMEQVTGAKSRLRTVDLPVGARIYELNTADFGVPQTRKRLYICGGLDAPSPTVTVGLDQVLPYLADEGDLIKGYKNTVSVHHRGEHLGNRALRGYEGFRSISEPTYTVCATGPLRLFQSTSAGPQAVRSLTIQEHLIIQGFPDDYEIPEGISKGDSFTLVGNAVSPQMAYLLMT